MFANGFMGALANAYSSFCSVTASPMLFRTEESEPPRRLAKKLLSD